MPANQYTMTPNASHSTPMSGSHRRHGALRSRSGLVYGARIAFTPGISQASNAHSPLNQAEPPRLSLPPGATLDGRSAKFSKITSTTEMPTRVRIAFSGARTRSLIAQNQLG